MNRVYFFLCAILASLGTFAQKPNVEYLNENKDIIYDLDMVDSARLAALASDYIAIWDLDKKSIIQKHQMPGADLVCLDVSGDRKLMAYGNKRSDLAIVQTGSNESLLKKSYTGQGAVTDVKFNVSDSLVASTFYSGFFVVINIASKDVWEYNIPEGRAISCGFSSNGKYLAVGDNKGIVRIYDLQSHTLQKEHIIHKALVKEIVWTDNDTRIVTASQNGQFRSIFNPLAANMRIAKGPSMSGTLSGGGCMPITTITFGCTLEGTVKIHFGLGSYKSKQGVAMHSVCAMPSKGIYMKLAVATNGKGVILIDSRSMKLND